MNKTKRIISVAVLSLSVFGLAVYSSYASNNTSSYAVTKKDVDKSGDARQSAEEFLDAATKKDVDKFLKHIKVDTRYKNVDKAVLKEEYKEISKQNPLRSHKILDVQQIDEDNALLVVEVSYPDYTGRFGIRMTKEEGQWLYELPGFTIR